MQTIILVPAAAQPPPPAQWQQQPPGTAYGAPAALYAAQPPPGQPYAAPPAAAGSYGGAPQDGLPAQQLKLIISEQQVQVLHPKLEQVRDRPPLCL